MNTAPNSDELPPDIRYYQEEYPAYLQALEYVSSLAEHVPDVFLVPPTEPLIECIAVSLASKNYSGVYLMGGLTLVRMIQLQLEENQQFEEYAKLDAMLTLHAPYTEPFHERKRAEQHAASAPNSSEEPAH
jgi:hypothetical protein